MRPLPELTPANRWFWTSGADGRLHVQGCDDCGTLVHPTVPICPSCRSRSWSPTEVSGRATVAGLGRSRIGRRLMVDPLSLTIGACLDAVADAGLTLEDIDGLSTYPGPTSGAGIGEGGVTTVEEALRIHPTWINGGGDIPGPGG